MPRLLAARFSFSRQHISSTAECGAADGLAVDVLSGPCKITSIHSCPSSTTNRVGPQLHNSGRRSHRETEIRFLAELIARECFPASAAQKNSGGMKSR